VSVHASEGDGDLALRPKVQELLNQVAAFDAWGVRRQYFHSYRLATRNEVNQTNRKTDTCCVTLQFWYQVFMDVAPCRSEEGRASGCFLNFEHESNVFLRQNMKANLPLLLHDTPWMRAVLEEQRFRELLYSDVLAAWFSGKEIRWPSDRRPGQTAI
jgi:hypothetical protein